MLEDQNSTVITRARDPAGLSYLITVTVLPATGSVYECDADDHVLGLITPDSLPHVCESARFEFAPAKDDQSQNVMKWTATNSAGLVSNEATSTFNIYTVNDVPVSPEQVEELPEGERGVVLEVVVADPDDKVLPVLIMDLPVQGKLYYDGGEESQLLEK